MLGGESPPEVGGAAADLETAGEGALDGATPLDTLLHDVPDVQQTGANLGLGTPGQLVGQHDIADGQAGFPVRARSSSPERNGCGRTVSSCLIRSVPVAVSSTMKPPPTE
ncbi:hypothetical protein GCM10018954_057780 [Kutzneria kofuensis]